MGVPTWDGHCGWRAMQAFDQAMKADKICDEWVHNKELRYPEHPAYFWGRIFVHQIGLGDFERSRLDVALRPQFHDLWFLYWTVRRQKIQIAFEYGVGYSTVVMAQAMYHNGFGWVQSLDAESGWIGTVWDGFPDHLRDRVAFMCSRLIERRFHGRKVFQYLRAPYGFTPDLIYVDAPDLMKGEGAHYDGIVDPLYLEHRLRRGCLLIVDGRPKQCQMLYDNFKRPWKWTKRRRWDNSIAELLD